MEYSLYNLNQVANVQGITLNEITNRLNLIGFEVDDIFYEELTTNKYLQNIRILVKVPSNRDDLLNEKFFLSELETIFLFNFYEGWNQYKKKYSFLLKKNYLNYYHYKSINISTNFSDILFYAIKIKNFKNISSPLWIQKKLMNRGLKVYDNIEDILNLVNSEWGHTFDFFSIKSNLLKKTSLVLKQNSEKEFYNLQDKEIEINKGNIILQTNENQILNILGIQNSLKKIMLENYKESEFFIQGTFYDIHNNSLLLNSLETKISYRFLRKSFLNTFKLAFQRLLTLLEVSSEFEIDNLIYSNIEKIKFLNSNRLLKLEIKYLKDVLNVEKINIKIFEEAGLKLICKTKELFYFYIPDYRKDLTRNIDLIEEYSRFVGYNKFQEIFPKKELKYSEKKEKNITFIKQFFLNYGFSEILTNPLEKLDQKNEILVKLNNPLNIDLNCLRMDLLSKIIETFEINSRINSDSKSYFEIGRTFFKENEKIIEIEKLSGIFQLERLKKEKQPTIEWFIAKGLLENFLEHFGYKNLLMESLNKYSENIYNIKHFHQTKAIQIISNGKILGIFGEINPLLKSFSNTKFNTYIFEFNLHYFKNWRLTSVISNYKEYSRYPSIIKDLSFKINKHENFNKLKKNLKNISKTLKEIEFFDIYFYKDSINFINLGIRLEFKSTTETLLTEKIDQEIELIKEYLIKEFSVEFEK